MNRREVLKAGISGLTSSLSIRLAVEGYKASDTHSDLRKRVATMGTIRESKKREIAHAKENNPQDVSKLEGELFQTNEIADDIYDTYKKQGGSTGVGDRNALVSASAGVSLYSATVFFEICSKERARIKSERVDAKLAS